jgi:hypothetical protein
MQGGVAHRYYTLRDASTGDLIPNATITLSAGGQGQSDANGIADLAMYADTLAGSSSLPVTPTVSVTGVWVGGDRYDVLSPPTFQVGIHPRSFTHEWNGGTVRKAKGGVSAGLVAYLGGQTKGGLGWELEETDASVDSDDTLKLKEEFEAELGGGIGIGAELGLKGWFSSASVGGSATTEAYARSLAEWQALFEDPYSDPQQKAQAAFVLAGLMDMAVGAPGQPMLAAILTRLAPSSDYAAYTDHVAAGVGAQWTPAHVHAGAEINLAKGLTKSALLELEALDAQAMLALFGTLTDYQHDQLWGLSLEQEVSVDVSALAVQTPIREKIGLYVGERTAKIKEELFLDKATGAPVKFELSFTGEGNELTFQDIVLQDVTYKFIVEGEDLNAALDAAIRNLTALMAAWEAIESQGLIVGRTAALREINAFLNSVPLSRYEVVAGTEGTLTLVPEIGFSAGVKVELGAGVEFKQGRELLIERGYATLTRLFPTEVYPDRQYGSTAGKSIWDLLGNAAHGAWLIVKDAFQSIVHSIQAGIEWTVDIIAQTADGIIHGGARLSSPGGGRLLLRSEGVLSSLEATSTITVTAASWVANEGGALQSLVQVSASPLDAAFVIGGVYQFTPEGLEIEPAATLEITYTAEALGGIDPAGLSIYRWDGNESAWQPLASTVDADNRVVTTTVGQLGTYAIGYDATPPVISIVEPVSGTTQATYYPWITALITDTGVGVDPASVALILDDTPILTADYYTYTHQLVYTPTIGLANGPHTVEVTARDTAGNEALASSTFTVNVPPPSIEAMTPTIVCGDVSTSVTISGTNFALMPTVQIETTPLSDVAYYGTTLVTTTVPATVAAGTYDVTVINPDSQSDTLPNGLTVSILGDFNCDCAVNVADIMIVANKWRCRSGDDCYDERYDIDKDNDIDIVDIMLVAVHWGETC